MMQMHNALGWKKARWARVQHTVSTFDLRQTLYGKDGNRSNSKGQLSAIKLRTALDHIVARRSHLVSFADTYHAAFDLLLMGEGFLVYQVAISIFCKLSLSYNPEDYTFVSEIICNLCALVNDRYVLPKGFACTKDMSDWLYHRPVAARWRHLRRVARWVGRICVWLTAFKELVDLAPGGKIAQRCELEFYSLV
jgi:hypothetical protein